MCAISLRFCRAPDFSPGCGITNMKRALPISGQLNSGLQNSFEGAVKKVPSKRQAAPNGAACKIYVEKGLVQWKNQPFGVIMNL